MGSIHLHRAKRNGQRTTGNERIKIMDRQRVLSTAPTKGVEGARISSSGTPRREVSSFKDLKVWEKGMSLAERIYHLTEQFPSSEKFGLISQLRRAAVSVPSNVAEGYRRRSLKEFQQFLNISIGSIGEIETQIILAGRLRFFQASEQSALLEDLDHLLRMTINLKTKMCR